jgi:protein-disulfide isomerase
MRHHCGVSTSQKQTKQQRREAARQARLEAERAAALSARRKRRLTMLGAVLGLAAVLVVVAVVVSSGNKNDSSSRAGKVEKATGAIPGQTESREMLTGIPQQGIYLGNPKAPVRFVEFADLQCPFCAQYALSTMPGIVQRYVRPGDVRMEFRSLAFIGPDSVRAARVAQAAAQQDKLWNFIDLAYRNQGKENSGWATDALLRRVATAVPGLDADRAFAARDGAAVTGALKAADSLAATSGVQSTPTFLVGRGSSLKAVDAAGLEAAIKAAVAR